MYMATPSTMAHASPASTAGWRSKRTSTSGAVLRSCCTAQTMKRATPVHRTDQHRQVTVGKAGQRVAQHRVDVTADLLEASLSLGADRHQDNPPVLGAAMA
jgi:hypothetical protein